MHFKSDRRSFFSRALLGLGVFSGLSLLGDEKSPLQPPFTKLNSDFQFTVIVRCDFPENKNFRAFENDLKRWSNEKEKDAIVIELQEAGKLSREMNFTVSARFFEARMYFKDETSYKEYRSRTQNVVYRDVQESLGYRHRVRIEVA
jgi:hypothetical protein